MRNEMPFQELVLGEGSSGYEMTRRIVRSLEPFPVKFRNKDQGDGFKADDRPDMGKDVVELLQYRGGFLKPCPGTREYICCGYRILNVATNCPLDCSYCILQSYFNQPNVRIFANLEEEIDNVFEVIDTNPEEIFRIGTGEFTDSLAVDHLTGWSELLLPGFSRRKNAILELKTKTSNIAALVKSGFRDQIVAAWTLNSPFIANTEEHRAPGLRKRLEAASICQEEGFVLAFHFDPLIYHPRWKEEYLKTLDLLAEYVDPRGIIWVSLGSFRYVPELKEIIRRRHPGTCILDGEFIKGMDGKMRYFKPLRIDLYSFMIEHLQKWHSDLGIYLCMESDEVWRKARGWSPGESKSLAGYLDDRVRSFFG